MKAYDSLKDPHRDFIAGQHIFFVGSAPLAADGHVNVSPKGLDSFTILDDTTVAYLDLGGSGIETHAHILENGRLCIMFCAFDGDPNILRLYGRGRAHPYATTRFEELRPHFPAVTVRRCGASSSSTSHVYRIRAVGGCPSSTIERRGAACSTTMQSATRRPSSKRACARMARASTVCPV